MLGHPRFISGPSSVGVSLTSPARSQAASRSGVGCGSFARKCGLHAAAPPRQEKDLDRRTDGFD